MDLISSKISDLDFSDQTALIIGGSRGLGETVSKIISASGGKVVLTYYKGKEDAQDLMNEINKYKNSCSILGLNVLNEEEVKKNLGILIDEVDMIFYFASPKIKLSDDRNSLDLMDLYRDFYVNGFKEVVKVFKFEKKITIFYPSTEFINTKDKTFKEYIIAKKEGEEFCNLIANNNIDVYAPRLPRLLTDQTIGVVGLKIEKRPRK